MTKIIKKHILCLQWEHFKIFQIIFYLNVKYLVTWNSLFLKTKYKEKEINQGSSCTLTEEKKQKFNTIAFVNTTNFIIKL